AKVGQAFSLPGERSSPLPFFPSPPAHRKFPPKFCNGRRCPSSATPLAGSAGINVNCKDFLSLSRSDHFDIFPREDFIVAGRNVLGGEGAFGCEVPAWSVSVPDAHPAGASVGSGSRTPAPQPAGRVPRRPPESDENAVLLECAPNTPPRASP